MFFNKLYSLFSNVFFLGFFCVCVVIVVVRLNICDRHRCHLTDTSARAWMEELLIKTIDNIRGLYKKFKL